MLSAINTSMQCSTKEQAFAQGRSPASCAPIVRALTTLPEAKLRKKLNIAYFVAMRCLCGSTLDFVNLELGTEWKSEVLTPMTLQEKLLYTTLPSPENKS